MPLRRTASVWLPLLAALLAALWPLTSYKLGPFFLPFVVASAAALVIIITRPAYGLALVLALAPLTNLQTGTSKYFHVLIPAMCVGLLFYGALVARSERLHVRALTFSVLFFLAASVASSFAAIEPSKAITKLIVIAAASAFFFAVIEVCRSRREAIIVASGAVVGLLVAAVHGLAQFITGSFATYGEVGGGGDVGRIQGAFGHPNTYGGFVATLIPLAVAMAFSRAFPAKLRVLAGTAAVLGIPAVALSYSRGAIIGLVLGSIIWLAVVRPRWAVAVTVVSVIAAVAFVPGTLKERFAQGSAQTGGEVTLRSDIWAAALDIYTRAPIVGAGLNNFGTAYGRLPSTPNNATQKRLLHGYNVIVPPHAQNQYLNILAEQGIIGIFGFLLLFGGAIRLAFRTGKMPDAAARAIGMGVGAGLVALAIQSLLDAFFIGEIAFPFYGLAAVLGVLCALRQPAEAVEEGPGVSRPAWPALAS